ncbi:MAG: hypothetical protein Q4G07_03680 [Oscillospiraceae bacterium]|nr:hypothetical protein [Oscillospiraceae bacterium]
MDQRGRSEAFLTHGYLKSTKSKTKLYPSFKPKACSHGRLTGFDRRFPPAHFPAFTALAFPDTYKKRSWFSAALLLFYCCTIKHLISPTLALAAKAATGRLAKKIAFASLRLFLLLRNKNI